MSRFDKVFTVLCALSLIGLGATMGQQLPPEYDRGAFRHWVDDDRDGQNTRAEVLIAWSEAPVTFTSERRSTVAGGRWTGAYTGETFTLARQLDIDHVIPLAWAWARGAWRWTPTQREAFANDPRNLLPVQASANRRKGARGPLEWLPPREAFRCEYLLRWTRVALAYDLPVSVDLHALRARACEAAGF